MNEIFNKNEKKKQKEKKLKLENEKNDIDSRYRLIDKSKYNFNQSITK